MGYRSPRAKRPSWDQILYRKWPFVVLGIGVLALVIAAHDDDDARGCNRHVMSTAKTIDQTLPADPVLTRAKFERLSYAADLCGRGQTELATHILNDLGDESPRE